MPKRKSSHLLALASFLPLAACTQADPPTEPRQEAVVAPAEEPVHRIDPSELPSPPESPQAIAPVSSPEQGRLQDLLAAMSEASEEAAAAEGETHCERAYASSRSFAASLRERMGGEPIPPDTPERSAEFIRACDDMPQEVQRCMVMGYSVANQQECAGVRREMSDATRESVRRLMAELGPLGEAAAGTEPQ